MSTMDYKSEEVSAEVIAHRLVPERCGACVTAYATALSLAEKIAEGSLSTDDAERRYDLALGGKCVLGVIELADVGHCLVSDSHVVIPQKPLPVF